VIKIGRFFLFLIFILSSVGHAQVVLRATVDQEEVGLGELFEVVVSIVMKKNADVGEPRIPNLDGFVLKGQSSSSKTSYNMVQTPSGMDWQSQIQHDYKYALVAQRTGQLSIGSFEVIIDGKTQTTQPILIKVVKEGTRKNPRPQQRPG